MIKVMVVDDSAVVRQVLGAVLSDDAGMRVIATASDPIAARDKMKSDWPDVIVLDVDMPRMDGITFLRQLMAERPTPVVICSAVTERGAKASVDAMSAGAVTVISKPKLGLRDFLQDQGAKFRRVVRDAAGAKPGRSMAIETAATDRTTATNECVSPQAMARISKQVVAIGTSTGGTRALEVVLSSLPRECPGLVIVQHMPEKFTLQLAHRLNNQCRVEVREASHGDQVLPGQALIAPGGRHIRLVSHGAAYHVETFNGPPVNHHRPSVDVLFRSTAKVAGRNALGIIMTGMGDDGARGLKEMHDAGAGTVAQDEASCVVFGMPNEAIKRGAVDNVTPLSSIARHILSYRMKS